MTETTPLPAPPALSAWVVDVLVVVGTLMASAPYVFHERRTPGEVHGTDVLVVLAGALPLLLRRRAPVPVLAWVVVLFVVTVVTGPRPFAAAAVLVALYTVAASCGPRALLASVAAVEASVVLAVLVVGERSAWFGGTVFASGLVVAAVALGRYAATRRSYLDELRERTVRMQHEREQEIALAGAAERDRLAREMHDIVAHHLTVMVALSEGAVAAVGTSPERAAEAMRAVGATGRRALSDTRGLLGVLPEDGTESRQPVPALSELDALVRQVREAGLPVTVEVSGVPGDLPAGVQLTVYRLVQEALTNTLKHAGPGASATVRLGFTGSDVTVDVEDDGTGTPSPGGGRGLVGMRERVQAFGGEVRAGPRTPRGWSVSARLGAGGGPS